MNDWQALGNQGCRRLCRSSPRKDPIAPQGSSVFEKRTDLSMPFLSSHRDPDQTGPGGQGRRKKCGERGAEPHVPPQEGLHDSQVPGPAGDHRQAEPGGGHQERNDVLPDAPVFQVSACRTLELDSMGASPFSPPRLANVITKLHIKIIECSRTSP